MATNDVVATAYFAAFRRAALSYSRQQPLLSSRGFFQFLHAQADTALTIHFQDLHANHVTFFQGIADFLDPLVRNLGNVYEAILARQDFDESAELREPACVAVKLGGVWAAGVIYAVAAVFLDGVEVMMGMGASCAKEKGQCFHWPDLSRISAFVLFAVT